MSNRSLNHYIVYIPDEECYGVTLSIGAHVSLVRYQSEGIDHEVFLLNEDIMFIENITIGLEEEEY